MTSLPPPTADRIRVRPNLHTLSLIGVTAAMWYAGAVQSNGAASLLAFLAAMLGAFSYVHARANLRGLRVSAGEVVTAGSPAAGATRSGRGEAIPPAATSTTAAEPAATGRTFLPLILEAGAQVSPCGLEVLAAGSGTASFIDSIPSGGRSLLSLKLGKERGIAVSGGPVRVIVRSAFPLGLFSAEREVEFSSLRAGSPAPAGDLPLPPPDPALRTQAQALSRQQPRHSAPGDDFAGLRLWQAGDSPRHIDWRALARGRPMLVKTWSASAVEEAVHLDWHALPLPESERPGQLAQWIDMCESRGTPYALTLPQIRVPVGLGSRHARRCREALAQLAPPVPAPKQAAKPKRTPPSFEKSAHLPRGPLIGLCAALLGAAVPLVELVPPLSLVLLVLCFVWRLFLSRPNQMRWLPLTVMAGGMGAVAFAFGEVQSLEVRVTALLVLLSAKLLESRTPHDFQVLAMIGWFLCLCGLLVEQSFMRAVYTFALFAVMAACMVRFRRSAPGLRVPVKVTGTLLALALPLAAVLFLVFPRLGPEDLGRIGNRRVARTGIPPELDPGSIAELARSGETAFRVKFPNGQPPPNQQRYWRCLVMWDCNGLRWSQGPRLFSTPRFGFSRGTGIQQNIILEPHGQTWLPALDWPIRARDSDGLIEPNANQTLTSFQPVLNVRRIEITSLLDSQPVPLPEAHREAGLQLPENLPPAVRALAAEWRAAYPANDAMVVQTALNFFRTQGFEYTLDPGEFSGAGALEDFLLRRRVGFCGHFSAGFATLMRLAGVPCRVVMGYLGGEWSERGGYLTIRQSDAHAWTEVWLEQVGWARVDPTAALAPDRVNIGLQAYLQGGNDAMSRQRASLWWRARETARMFWEDVNNAWYDHVVSFDEDVQNEWLSWAGLDRLRHPMVWLMGLSVLITGLSLAARLAWLHRPARPRDPWVRAWHRLGRRLVRMGLPARRPNEGPLAYAQRAAPARSDVAELAQAYAAARYGGGERMPLRDFKRAIRRI